MKRIIQYLIILFLLFIPIINVDATELNEIKSNNVILYNLNDDNILYEKNSDDKVLIASMTKIMTTIVAIENINDMDEKITLNDQIFSGLANDLSFAGFKKGEVVTYRDLLYGALLPSGADATHALAVFISGSEEEFVKLMNKKAEELGMTNTNFTNTIGIEDSNNMHYSTVKDVAVLLKYSLKNKDFKKIFTTEKYTTSDNILDFKSTKLKTSEKNGIDLSFIKGSKTGYTSKAGLCLASIADYNNVDYLLVTAGADYKSNKINHFLDAKNIYEYYFSNYAYKKILKKDQLLKKIKTKYEQDVNIIQNKNVEIYLKNDIKNKDLTYKYEGIKNLQKGIKKGDTIGKYIVSYKGKILYNEDILSPVTVKFRLTNNQKILILMLFTTIIFINVIIKIMQNRRQKKSYFSYN